MKYIRSIVERARLRRYCVFVGSLIFCASVMSCVQDDSLDSAILGLVGQSGDGLQANAAEAIFTNNSNKNIVAVLYDQKNLGGNSYPLWITKGQGVFSITAFPSSWKNKTKSVVVRAGTNLTLYTQSAAYGLKLNAPANESLAWGDISDSTLNGGAKFSMNVSSQKNAVAIIYSSANYTGSILPVWPASHEALTESYMGSWSTKVKSIVVNETLTNGYRGEIEIVGPTPESEHRIEFESVPNVRFGIGSDDMFTEIYSYLVEPPKQCTQLQHCYTVDRTCDGGQHYAVTGPRQCAQNDGRSYCSARGNCMNPHTGAPIPWNTPGQGPNYRRLSNTVNAEIQHIAESSAPSAPASGWYVNCYLGPDTFQSGETCDVLVYKGLKYWAFTHNDNRFAMAIAAYNSSNQLVAWQQKNGARYPWRTSIDADNLKVYFLGQGDDRIGIALDSLPGQSAPAKVRMYRDANYSVLQRQLAPGEYPDFTQSPVNWNDQLSSLRVPVGYTVTLYENANYEGDSRTYHADTSWVGSFNDKASSMIITEGTWVPIGGFLKQVSVGFGSQVWGVNSANNIYRYHGSGWTQIPGKLKHVSVGQNNVVWGVDASDNIRRYNSGNNTWTNIAGKLKQVEVGAGGEVWGVNSANNIYRYNGNNSWTQISGLSGGLKHVSVGQNGVVWGVNASDSIYRYNGNNTWTNIPGGLKQVDVSANGEVWGVNSANSIYRYNGSGWNQLFHNSLKHVSIGQSGNVWGVQSNDVIQRLR